MKTPGESIVMFVAAALLGAVGQYLYKSGADRAVAGWLTEVVATPAEVTVSIA